VRSSTRRPEMAFFWFKINQLKLSLQQEELVEYCGLGLHKP
jgi:hypothetical protein